MLRTMFLAALVGLLALSTVPVGATDASVSATATKSGGSAVVSGQATFVANDGPFEVGGTVNAFQGGSADDAADALGINIKSASVEVSDDGVEFIWQLNELGDVPPEGVRYTWAFGAGGQSFQLQAKRTNVASITTAEDPVGHAQKLASGGDWFQLRGACEANYQGTAVSGCYHLAFLTGSFNDADNTVTMFMPFNTRDRIQRVVAEGFQRGAEITAEETAGSSITATVQAVVSNTQTESFINGWKSFFAGETVQAFAGKSGQTAPTFGQAWDTLDLNADGTFSGTVSGLTASNDTVIIRACNLDTCAMTEVTP